MRVAAMPGPAVEPVAAERGSRVSLFQSAEGLAAPDGVAFRTDPLEEDRRFAGHHAEVAGRVGLARAALGDQLPRALANGATNNAGPDDPASSA
jgi:hypothetical protein